MLCQGHYTARIMKLAAATNPHSPTKKNTSLTKPTLANKQIILQQRTA